MREEKIYFSPTLRSKCIEVRFNSFEALLKKWPNITSIELEKDPNFTSYLKIPFHSLLVNEVFRLIIENCNNLSEIKVLNDIVLNESNFEKFHQKFGQKIKSLTSLRELFNLSRFPNIEKIVISNVQGHSIIPHLKSPKLKQLDLGICQGQEDMLQIVIDNSPKLTHLKILFKSFDENGIYKSLKNISNLKHLIHFQFRKFGINNKQFCDLLKQMANNSQNLKTIECLFVMNDNISDIRQLFSDLKAFPLKRLNFRFFSDGNEEDVNQLFSFELFKGFQNITHLTLYFNLSQTLKESILKEIDINLPKLQYLEISNIFDTTAEGVQQMADILSRLSRLQTLKLKFKSGVDFQPIEEQITKKCRKIKEIKNTNELIQIESDSDSGDDYDSDSNDSDSEIGSDSDTESDNSSDNNSDSKSD